VVSFKLIRRNLTKHKMRSLLTVASLMVGIFLLCVLKSMVVALENEGPATFLFDTRELLAAPS
jgi:Rod binding domain-containing protein